MCGICGELRFDGVQPGNSTVTAMMARLERRGPDAAGRYADGPVALGHRRLAVIDLSGGSQPRLDHGTGTRLFYNGELYNHRELRRELEELLTILKA